MAKIYLVRHGRSQHDGSFVGTTESELAKSGVEDVVQLKKRLDKVAFNHLYCSPRKRCLQTAALLGVAERVEIVADLQEIDFGVCEGLSFSQVRSCYPALYEQLVHNPLECIFPQGQSMRDFAERVRAGIERRVTLLGTDEQVLIISHGGVIRVLLCFLLGIDMDKLNSFSPDPGSCSVVDYCAGKGVLEAFNVRD